MERKIIEEAVDLNIDGLFVLQNKNGYTLSSDAVLLANYIKLKPTDVYVDLCSGSGIIGILANIKQKPKKTYLVEIQDDMVKLINKSIEKNGYNVTCVKHDATDLKDVFNDASVDAVSINPPYYKKGEGKLSDSDEINIARHELKATLEDLIKESSRILKHGGSFYIVNSTKRLADSLFLLKKYHLGTKELTLVYPNGKSEANIFLAYAKKGYKEDIKFKKPIFDN